LNTLARADWFDTVSGLLRRPHTQASELDLPVNLAPPRQLCVLNPENSRLAHVC
jgi:hypothetical protein